MHLAAPSGGIDIKGWSHSRPIRKRQEKLQILSDFIENKKKKMLFIFIRRFMIPVEKKTTREMPGIFILFITGSHKRHTLWKLNCGWVTFNFGGRSWRLHPNEPCATIPYTKWTNLARDYWCNLEIPRVYGHSSTTNCVSIWLISARWVGNGDHVVCTQMNHAPQFRTFSFVCGWDYIPMRRIDLLLWCTDENKGGQQPKSATGPIERI